MNVRELAAVLTALIADTATSEKSDLLQRFSRRDLAVIEGILQIVLSDIQAEQVSRDAALPNRVKERGD